MHCRGSESELASSLSGLGPFEIVSRTSAVLPAVPSRKEVGKRLVPSRYDTFLKERYMSMPTASLKASQSYSSNNVASSWDVVVASRQSQRVVKLVQRNTAASRSKTGLGQLKAN